MPTLEEFLGSLPPAQRDALLNEAAREAARRDAQATPLQPMPFEAFKVRFWRNYKPAPYDPAINVVLQGVADYVTSGGVHGIGKLMIHLPPRHGKTMRISRLFPAWMLSQMPDLPIIAASYGLRLAEKNTRFVRNLVQRREYQAAFPQVRLIGTASDHWETTLEGGMLAAGVGSAVVGFGARLIILDDPTRSRADAESQTVRTRAHDWWADDLTTRLEEPGGALIIMATRYHTDDVPGHVLAVDEDEDLPQDESWHILNLPALAEENDPLGRAPGEALWADRYPAEWLDNRRRKMGEYSFASLYQQRPIPRGESPFDTGLVTVLDTPPPVKRAVRFYDLAVSAKTRADYSVGLLLGEMVDGRLVVLDVWRKQLAPADVAAGIKYNARLDGVAVRIRLETDNAARVQLDFLLRDPELRPYTIDGVSPEGDKYTRAAPVATRVSAGQLVIVRASWNRAFLDELGTFPAGGHDDQVDALSGAYKLLDAGFSQAGRVRVIFPYQNNIYNVPADERSMVHRGWKRGERARPRS